MTSQKVTVTINTIMGEKTFNGCSLVLFDASEVIFDAIIPSNVHSCKETYGEVFGLDFLSYPIIGWIDIQDTEFKFDRFKVFGYKTIGGDIKLYNFNYVFYNTPRHHDYEVKYKFE